MIPSIKPTRWFCLSAIALLAPIYSSAQSPNQSTLTLVNEPGFNELNITMDVPIVGSDTQTSVLTGTIDASFNIDPSTHQNDRLIVSNADVSGSDVNFSIFNFLTGEIVLTGSGLGANIVTTGAGNVNPLTGEFDASEHTVSVNEGNISGTAIGNNIDFDLTTEPVSGIGQGTGTVTLTHTGNTATRANYNITVEMPINISQQVPTGVILFGSELMATVTVTGTVKATGSTYVHLSPYLAWTEENNIPGAAFNAPSTSQVPNGILWAAGFNLSNAPKQLLELQGNQWQIALPAGGTNKELRIEKSTNLSQWNDPASGEVSTGSHIIPMGSTGTITISPAGNLGFFRLITQP